MARDTLLTDINLDTVDMMTNFDGNEEEPVVLPARLPVSDSGASSARRGSRELLPLSLCTAG